MSKDKVGSKYLDFVIIEQKPKTVVIEIRSKTHGYRLGLIKYYWAWRQYVFFSEPNMVFSKDCLNDIIQHIPPSRLNLT